MDACHRRSHNTNAHITISLPPTLYWERTTHCIAAQRTEDVMPGLTADTDHYLVVFTRRQANRHEFTAKTSKNSNLFF